MSNNNPPLSTEGGGVMDNVDDLISTPNSDPNIPLIDLSHIKKSLFDKDCRICCQYPEKDFFDESFERGLLQLQASRCVFCKIRLLIMEAVTRLEGVSPDITDRMFLQHLGDVDFYSRGGWTAWFHDVFIQSEAPRSRIDDIEDIVKVRRRNFTWDVSREDSIQRSIEWAKDQLIDQMCPCASRADDWAAPTRLIDVDPGGMGLDVQLRYSASIPQENLDYAALSYCWGGYEPECMTTPKTINENLRRISWESMPQTFRDTVTFTRGLGLKYLWIDSICIIQDKDKDGGGDDWRREAGKMKLVLRSKVLFCSLRNDGKDYLLDVDGETQLIPTWDIIIDSEQECFPDGSHAQDVYLFQIVHERRWIDFYHHTKCLILRLKDRAANSRTFSRVGVMSYKTPSRSRFDDDEEELRLHRLFEERGATEECEIE